MNIDKITKEYPRAWEECIRFFIHPHNYGSSDFKYIWSQDSIEIWEADGVYLDLEIHFRELYDYFDSVGIFISVEAPENGFWECGLYLIDQEDFIPITIGKTRTEAEFPAFEKGFEIRERQLKEVKGGI